MGRGFEPHRRHSVVSLSKNIIPSLVLVQPRKFRPFITKRLLIGRKESNQTKTLLCVLSSFAIILMGKRELVALFCVSSWCLVALPHGAVSWFAVRDCGIF